MLHVKFLFKNSEGTRTKTILSALVNLKVVQKLIETSPDEL